MWFSVVVHAYVDSLVLWTLWGQTCKNLFALYMCTQISKIRRIELRSALLRQLQSAGQWQLRTELRPDTSTAFSKLRLATDYRAVTSQYYLFHTARLGMLPICLSFISLQASVIQAAVAWCVSCAPLPSIRRISEDPFLLFPFFKTRTSKWPMKPRAFVYVNLFTESL